MKRCERKCLFFETRTTGSRPEALRQVIFADSETFASSGDPRFLSAFK